MTQRTWKRFRWTRRVAIVMAAAPLFQLSQCGHGLTQVVATSLNQAPSAFFQLVNGVMLLPIQLLLGGGTGTDTGTGGGLGNDTGNGGFGF
ncbi:MAG TPA: hypothetical protein VJZ71_20855 [Phycisphaerae bacterium]|nr:hypothetical protein [Phycisphaerae bacterium]